MKTMPMKNCKAVMFDIDACLIDSAPNLILTLERAVADTGGGHHSPEYLRKMLGLPGSALNDLFSLPDWELTYGLQISVCLVFANWRWNYLSMYIHSTPMSTIFERHCLM